MVDDVDKLWQAHVGLTMLKSHPKFLRCIFVAETGIYRSEKRQTQIQLFWGEGLLKETTNPWNLTF